MALKEFSKLNNILWPLEVKVCSRKRMLLAVLPGTEGDPSVAAGEDGIDRAEEGGLGNGGGQVAEHDLGTIQLWLPLHLS